MNEIENIIKKVSKKFSSYEGELDRLVRSIANNHKCEINDLEEFLTNKIENFSYKILNSNDFIVNIIENHKNEIDDFFDNISEFIVEEAEVRLSTMRLNLIYDSSNSNTILSEESKKINSEIVELIKTIPYSNGIYSINHVFFKDYNLLIYNFLNNSNNFSLNINEWFEDEDLEHLLKVLIVDFLGSVCGYVNNELIRIYEPYEHLTELVLNVVNTFNEIDYQSSLEFSNYPEDYDSKLKFLGQNYSFFLKHNFPNLFYLLSCTISNLYINILKKINYNRREIILGYLNDINIKHKSSNLIESYNWIYSNNKSLNMFYKKLIEGSFLNSDIKYNDFKKLFNKNSLAEFDTTLNLNLNITETILLVHYLMDYEIIEKEINWNWNRFKRVFNIDSTVRSLRAKKSSLLTKSEIDEDFNNSKRIRKISKILNHIKSTE